MARKKRSQAPHLQKCGSAFAAIPHDVIASMAYADLSCVARSLLIELVVRFNGWNNGKIGLDARTARLRLKCSPAKVRDAFDELLTHGMVEIAEEAVWTERRAREYRLTWLLSGEAPPYRQPSLAYREWHPDKPICSIARAVSPKPPRKIVVTDVVAGSGNLVTTAGAEPAPTATNPVTAGTLKPQKTANCKSAACYDSGSAYNNTIARPQLAGEATRSLTHDPAGK